MWRLRRRVGRCRRSGWGLVRSSGGWLKVRREPEAGVDFEIDEFAGGFLRGEPLGQFGARHMMDDDVFAAHATTLMFAHEVACQKQVGDFRRHAGGSWARDELPDCARAVAGFLEQFACGRVGQRFAVVFFFITDDAGGDFDHMALGRNAKLFDQHHFVIGRDREDADAGIGMRAADEIPCADAFQPQPAGFVKFLGGGHVVD